MGVITTSPDTAVVVTGGASGIGLATATALAESARPVVLWDLDADLADTRARELTEATGTPSAGFPVDVTDLDALAPAVGLAREAVGAIGGVVHCAGAVSPDPIGSLDAASWARVVDVNLRAYAFVVQALLPELEASSPGAAVVGVASIEAIVGHAAIPAYCASKAGLVGLTRSMAAQLGPSGIRVNAVCPGYVETPMLAPTLEIPGVREQFEASAVLGRIGRPHEIGRAIRFLLSDEAAFVTGTALVVDGGVTAVD